MLATFGGRNTEPLGVDEIVGEVAGARRVPHGFGELEDQPVPSLLCGEALGGQAGSPARRRIQSRACSSALENGTVSSFS